MILEKSCKDARDCSGKKIGPTLSGESSEAEAISSYSILLFVNLSSDFCLFLANCHILTACLGEFPLFDGGARIYVRSYVTGYVLGKS